MVACENEDCALWHLRMGRGAKGGGGSLKPIRAKCLDCGDGWKDVKDCGFLECPLWEYRFGKNPSLKGRRKNAGVSAVKSG